MTKTRHGFDSSAFAPVARTTEERLRRLIDASEKGVR
jgi:hypothetical protein